MHARALIVSCTLAALVPAQERPLPVLGKFTVPLHSAPDDPIAGAYGMWGAGHDYKVSFHDGFRFFPRLGRDAPSNLPLAWRTEAVRFGSKPLFEGGDTRGGRDGDWRYQFRHPGVVEAYEIRADGVEQSFTVLSGPATGGDLCIAGRLETELVPAARSWDQSVQFVDERKVARVTLGSSVASDARGRPLPVARRYVDGLLELRVVAADLIGALFPIRIRQLSSAVPILGGNDYRDIDFTCWISDGYLVVTSSWSQGDADSYGFHLIDPFTPQLFWADITSHWSTEHPRVACGPFGLVRTAFQRMHSNPSVTSVLMYTADLTTAGGLNIGAWANAPTTVGYTQRNPELDVDMFEGTILVWQEDLTTTNADTATTRVVAAPYRFVTNSFPVKWIVAEGPLFDTANPVIDGGFVFWQHQPNLNFLPSQIFARAIDGNGPKPGPYLHVSSAHAGAACTRPRAALGDTSLPQKGICVYEYAENGNEGLGLAMFEAGAITLTRDLWRSSQPSKLHDVCVTNTKQHFYLLTERAGTLQTERLGHSGGRVAIDTIHIGTAAAACVGPHWGPSGSSQIPVCSCGTRRPMP